MKIYRTADVSTLKGIQLAERLQRLGWKMQRVGLFTIQFYKVVSRG